MQVRFYRYEGRDDVVDKDLGNPIETMSLLFFKEQVDKEKPYIIVPYSQNLDNCNYCYIQELGYYYYMSEPILMEQRVRFDLSVDLLMTKKDEIKQLNCILERSESNYNAYLEDNKLPILAKQDVTCLKFPRGFERGEQLILVVNG